MTKRQRNFGKNQKRRFAGFVDRFAKVYREGTQSKLQQAQVLNSVWDIPVNLVLEAGAAKRASDRGEPYKSTLRFDTKYGFVTDAKFSDGLKQDLDDAIRGKDNGILSNPLIKGMDNPTEKLKVTRDALDDPVAELVVNLDAENALDPMNVVPADILFDIAAASKAGRTAKAEKIIAQLLDDILPDEAKPNIPTMVAEAISAKELKTMDKGTTLQSPHTTVNLEEPAGTVEIGAAVQGRNGGFKEGLFGEVTGSELIDDDFTRELLGKGGETGGEGEYSIIDLDQDISRFNFNKHLQKLIGPSPIDMIDPHAHHILFKEGNGAAQKELVSEGQALLRRNGIDPIYGKENLVWAPNRITGQHDIAALRNVVEQLKKVEDFFGDYDDFVEALKKLGDLAAKRRISR